MLSRQFRELERQADVIEQHAKSKKLTKDDFIYNDEMYYVANHIDIDGSGWVNQEQLELIIEELNNGVK